MGLETEADPGETARGERKMLVEEVIRFERLLQAPDLTPEDLQDCIEELRAIRMRIHEIDRWAGPARS